MKVKGKLRSKAKEDEALDHGKKMRAYVVSDVTVPR